MIVISVKLMDYEQDLDDGDEVKLSASTLAALQEFYAEQSALANSLVQDSDCQRDSNLSQVVMPSEDWVTDYLDYNHSMILLCLCLACVLHVTKVTS